MDHFSAIRVFLRFVEAGSLTRAAAQLDIPKSTASKLLSHLENYLGTKLINRSTRAAQLTKEGAEYYREVSQVMVRLSDIDSELKEKGSSPRGRVRVDVHSSMANSTLIPLLTEFKELYPDIQLLVGISDRPISLIEEAADCVIRLGKLPDASLIARVLFEDRMVTCASPAYLARKGLPTSPRDLANDHDLVGYFSAASGQAAPLTFQRGDEIHQFDQAGTMTNDSTGHLSMVVQGLGIGQLYRSTIHTPLSQGLLVPVLPEWKTPTAPVSLLYPPSAKKNNRVRVFIDWIVARLEQPAVSR